MYRGSNNKLRWCTITTVDTRGTSRWKSGWRGCEEECRENKRGIVIGRRISLGADYFPRINRSFLFVFPFFLSLSLFFKSKFILHGYPRIDRSVQFQNYHPDSSKLLSYYEFINTCIDHKEVTRRMVAKILLERGKELLARVEGRINVGQRVNLFRPSETRARTRLL